MRWSWRWLGGALLVAALAVPFGLGYLAGARTQVQEQVPAPGPQLTAEQATRVRAVALAHPTVQAVLAERSPEGYAISIGPVTGPTGELVGGYVAVDFAEPQTLRGEWLLAVDWRVRWPPTTERHTYTAYNVDLVVVWVDLASGQVVQVEPTGPYTTVAREEDPSELKEPLRSRAIEIALKEPWLAAVLAGSSYRIESVSRIQAPDGTLVGALVWVKTEGPVTLGGEVPIVTRDFEGGWQWPLPTAARASRDLPDRPVTSIVVLVDFDANRAVLYHGE
uniref:Uncharacterized protein n=1 Tax=Thermorudis peleae TaxID=1382356 RepID=A0A831TGL7_9BACT